MSPAQDILTRMGFVNIGKLKGTHQDETGLDLWEYRVEFAPEKTVHAAIPRTPDAQVSWAIEAIFNAGAARQQSIISQAHSAFMNTLKVPPGVPIQPNEPA